MRRCLKSSKGLAMILFLVFSLCTQMMQSYFVRAEEKEDSKQAFEAGDTEEYSGHYYRIVAVSGYTWLEAKAECEKMGGHLATITSQGEQEFMEEFNSNNFSLWIGGYRDDSDTWYWVTGESWEYTNWGEGEPNDSSSVVPDERYVTLWPQQWNDLANTNVLEQSGFVCEWDCADDVPTALPTQRPENTISPGVSQTKEPAATTSPEGNSDQEQDDEDDEDDEDDDWEDPIQLDAPKIKSIKSTYQGVLIKWSDDEDADSYTVKRNGKKLATVEENSYLDNSVAGGVNYTYQIIANGDEEFYLTSGPSTAKMGKLPKAVLKFKVKKNKKKFTLSWKNVSGAKKYIILRATKQKGTYKKVATVSKTTYTKKVTKKSYYYKVVVQVKNKYSPATGSKKA